MLEMAGSHGSLRVIRDLAARGGTGPIGEALAAFIEESEQRL